MLRRRQAALLDLKPGEYVRRMLRAAMAIVYRCPACERLVATDVHQVSGTGRSLTTWSCPECHSPEQRVQLLDYEPA